MGPLQGLRDTSVEIFWFLWAATFGSTYTLKIVGSILSALILYWYDITIFWWLVLEVWLFCYAWKLFLLPPLLLFLAGKVFLPFFLKMIMNCVNAYRSRHLYDVYIIFHQD